MNDVLVPILTFVGTAGTAGVTFWQWKRGQDREKSKTFRVRRAEALAELWSALQAVEAFQRKQFSEHKKASSPALLEKIRDVNLLLLRSAPFLLDDELDWAREYVAALIELEALANADDELGGDILGAQRFHDWAITAPLPRGRGAFFRAAGRLRDAADRLSTRYAEVIKERHE